MIQQRIKLLIKRIYNSFIMFTDDNIATAQIAQLFGSELLKVQESARTDSGSQPNIVKMDPKQFLVNSPQYQHTRKIEEQRLIQALQQEAATAWPLPDESSSQPITVQSELPTAVIQPIVNQLPQAIIPITSSPDALLRIAISLERIANKLDGVDIAIKKKRIKRTTK